MKQRLTMFFACLFLGIGMALAQSRLTGVVTSAEDGEPVVAASVKAKGLNVGTVTNVDGEFTINVPVGTELEITYLGMLPKRVKASNNMRIVLESDRQSLDGVVITGYGSARKLGTIAGSVSTVTSDKLANRPVANVGDALQGQVSGLQVFTSSGEPSATTSMRIRGVTSIYATTEPLFILDGSEISQNTFLSLNPNDIENMTVLKDASATAIYGSRAANGVVIITSKRGNFGESPTISISAQYGLSEMTGDNLDMMDANQWLAFQEMLNPSYKTDANFQAMKAYYKKYNIGTDWKEKLFGGTKPTSQIDVSIRGGSHNMSYLVSYGHYDADGIMDDSNMRRETLRANIESNVNDWLKVGANTNIAYTKFKEAAYGNESNSPGNKAFVARTFLPTLSYYEVLGLNPEDYANSTFEGYGKRVNVYPNGDYNPYYLSEIQPSNTRRVRLNENLFVNINPVKGLNIRSAVGLDANDLRSSSKCLKTPEVSFAEKGYVAESFSRFYRWTVTNTAEYKFNFLERHNVTVLLGQESMYGKTEAFGASADGFEDNRLLMLPLAAQKNVGVPSQGISEEVRNSWFGTLNYAYADKYFVDLSIRRDGSSLFGENNRWATFGAAAFMWSVAKENFMESTRSWLNDLQFKVSYGSTGNSGIDPYMALGLVGGGLEYNGDTGSAVANAPNPELTWETVKTFNVGLNGRLFNRLSFDVEFYNKVTSNMLVKMPYSYTTGFGTGWGNVAEMYNRGVDFNISYDIIKNKDWYWSVSLNGNYNKNKVTKLFKGADSYDVTNLIHLEKGYAYGTLYQVRWSHVDPADGQTVWLDKNGNETKVFSEDNRVMLDKGVIAPWSGGFSTTVSWKGLQLDVQFIGMFDRYMANNDLYFVQNPAFATQGNQSTAMLNMWTHPGQITNIAAANCQRQLDTSLFEDASFVRLKFLQLSYSLPQDWLNATKIVKGAKVYFIGRNLLTFTGYHGYDPEVDDYATLGNYPNTRQYSFGIQLTL